MKITKENIKKIIIGLIISIGVALGLIKYNSAGEAVVVTGEETEQVDAQETPDTEIKVEEPKEDETSN